MSRPWRYRAIRAAVAAADKSLCLSLPSRYIVISRVASNLWTVDA